MTTKIEDVVKAYNEEHTSTLDVCDVCGKKGPTINFSPDGTYERVYCDEICEECVIKLFKALKEWKMNPRAKEPIVSAHEDYPLHDDAGHCEAMVRASLVEKERLAFREVMVELRNIINAKRENFTDAEEFRTWAQSRAQHILEKFEHLMPDKSSQPPSAPAAS